MEGLSAELRRFVFERAEGRCEYCLLPQRVALHKHEPDHIIPRQHGGQTQADNLALACFRCNRYKGPNLGSIDPLSGELVGFYNPRRHVWQEHFELIAGEILAHTPEARVTIVIFRLNNDDRVVERRTLIAAGIY